ncbi:MAG: MerR family transcriptional regulator [Solibacillus sp.]
MRTNEIAQLANVHPNTVRLYEAWHYISPVPRLSNGYHDYSAIHVKQLLIARLAFRQEFIQNNLRKKATKIVQLSGLEQFADSLQAARDYLHYLQGELRYAQQAVRMVDTLPQAPSTNHSLYTHKEMAEALQLTEESIRNWERNGLFTVARNAQNRRQYTEADKQKLLIIRTLRSAHFSIASILHLFEDIAQVEQTADLHVLLNTPKFTDEFYHATDALEVNLKKAMTDVASIITLLEELH